VFTELKCGYTTYKKILRALTKKIELFVRSKNFLPYPRKNKYLKPFKEKLYKNAKLRVNSRSGVPCYGILSLKILETCKLQLHQVEAIRRLLNKWCKKKYKIKFNVNFSVALTKKPSEVRMGKGKGKICWYVCNVKAGSIFFEISGYEKLVIHQLLKYVFERCPFRAAVLYNNRKNCL
jgi:large subunit ribosomal protein L16